jgi:methylenetetrahydrofolate dehydrogenase (NADP+)/methenyltetrahydrofolate cyclohydrolase
MRIQPTAAKIIDGRRIADQVRREWRERGEHLRKQKFTPGLAVLLVGENPASIVYVRNKLRASAEMGIESREYRFPVNVPQARLLDQIRELNSDPRCHGILVQLPLPPQISMRKVLEEISPDKDVDGFHLYNVAGLVSGDTVFPPCTPYGVLCLLDRTGIPIAGQNVTVVGASNIVGKPMGLMLLQREATVAICHKSTRDLAQFTIAADILIVAAGHPNLVTAPMVKTGAVVIDVGIHRLPEGGLIGDVHFQGVSQKASYITPVPGGVGPMTVTMVLCNTIASAERFRTRETTQQGEVNGGALRC